MLVFVDPKYLPSKQREKQEYDLHINDENDLGYRQFLNKLAEPLTERLRKTKSQSGLDFGCGPGPLLVKILEENGFKMDKYDPIYFCDDPLLTQKYDFITCTEAIEHFHSPANELNLWQHMLNHNGWLAIMTKRVIDKQRFANWHYKNDLTHVCFFSDATFNWIAKKFGFDIKYLSNDVVIMQQNH